MSGNEVVVKKNFANPDVVDIEIGIHDMRKIKIYPLSMADQLSTSDLIVEALNGFFALGEEKEDSQFLGFVITLIQDNISRILDMVTYKEDATELLKTITNKQALAIANSIYETNYADLLKNVKGLAEKIKPVSPLTRP